MDAEVKTPEEWSKLYRIRVLDPDGWRFTFTSDDGVSYEPRSSYEQITEKEWWARVVQCTIQKLK